MKYDAIVIGSGITGGLAAKELCQSGLKVLLLERGKDVKHVTDYTTAMMKPWEFKNRLARTVKDAEENPVQSQSFDYNEGNKHFYVKDAEHPYIQDTSFYWIRGYQVGGRSLIWGRQCYRWSDLDFEANLKDGHGVDWPIRYNDIKEWYDYVESYIGVSGNREQLAQLPDGEFLPPMQLNCMENYLRDEIFRKYPDRLLTIARVANLTVQHNDRGPCMNRNLCSRGCPFGAYFSSNSTTIPDAMATGNLTLRPFSIVTEIIYDDKNGKASGVVVCDTQTKEKLEFESRIIFLNASTIASAGILLNSKSARFPDGMGNDSGELGHNLMDHHSTAGATAEFDGLKDKYYSGRRPCGFFVPRFVNLANEQNEKYLRGYNIQGTALRKGWQELKDTKGFGEDFKDRITKPGNWSIWFGGYGECLPYHENKVYLSESRTDQWGQPLIHIKFSFGSNESKMMDGIKSDCAEMLEKTGCIQVSPFRYRKPGGSSIHEMGTARMGNDPRTSVLNKYNQIHAVRNVFVTDGSCMTSSACQNPSLTYMALTARACNFAINEMKAGRL